jgi:integrase/recombinase XerC
MEEFKNYLREHYHCKENTVFEKEKQLLQWKNLYSKKQNFDKIASPELLKIAEIQKKKYTDQTLNNQLKTIEQYFEYLIFEEKRKDNPIKNFRIKTDKKAIITGYLTEEELNSIYENYSARGHFRGQFDLYRQRKKVVLGLMIYQGLSSGCLKALNVKDIDLKKAIIQVPAATESKLRARTLPLEAVQMLELSEYLNHTRIKIMELLKHGNCGELFTFSEKNKFCSVTKAIRKQIKISHIQQLRNSRINLWLNRYNLREVQYKAGYRSLLSLEKFNRSDLEHLKQALEKYLPE